MDWWLACSATGMMAEWQECGDPKIAGAANKSYTIGGLLANSALIKLVPAI